MDGPSSNCIADGGVHGSAGVTTRKRANAPTPVPRMGQQENQMVEGSKHVLALPEPLLRDELSIRAESLMLRWLRKSCRLLNSEFFLVLESESFANVALRERALGALRNVEN
jgi:hypothetical protein